MARSKIDTHELAALGAAALFPVALFGQIANAVWKGMSLNQHEAAVVQLFIEHGVARWGDGGVLELSPTLSKAIANLAGTSADLKGAFTEIRPALELGMIKIPAAALSNKVRA